VAAAAYPASALLTADARGVLVIGYLTDLPASWVTAATQAHERLKAEPGRDMTGLATHRPSGPSNGPLVPVQEG
jgi:hypothetical protein